MPKGTHKSVQRFKATQSLRLLEEFLMGERLFSLLLEILENPQRNSEFLPILLSQSFFSDHASLS
jgi:hypothetical protein